MNLEAVRAFVTVAEEGQFQLTRVSCHAADVRCERGHSGAAKARPRTPSRVRWCGARWRTR
jgi:hypothetical protein